MAAYDDLDGKRIATISVISIVVTAVTVLAVQVLFFAMAEYVDQQKVESSSYARQNRYLAEQAEEVSSFGIDAETGNVVVPVEQVMKEMAAEKSDHLDDQA